MQRYKIADQYSQLLEDSATVAWDLNLGPVAVLNLDRDRALSAPTNPVNGDPYVLIINPPRRGTATLTMAAGYEQDGSAIGSVTLNAEDSPMIYAFTFDTGEGAFISHDMMDPQVEVRGWRGYMDAEDIDKIIEVVSDPADEFTEVGLISADDVVETDVITIWNKGFGRVKITAANPADYVGKTVMEPFEVRSFTMGGAGVFGTAAKRPAKIGFPGTGGSV